MRLDDFDDGIRIEDQRGGGFGGGLGGGGGFSGGGGLISLLFGILPLLLRGKMGCGTIAILGVVGALYLFSGSAMQLSNGADTGGSAASSQAGTDTASSCTVNEASKEACNTLASLDKTWAGILQNYQRPKMVFYNRDGTSGCGAAQSAMGPFYCPSDQGIYLDTTFFQQMETSMGAKGDFARSYVIAHEMGHHIQTLTGISDQVRKMQARASREQGNGLQVRMELQADCYAGVWAARNADRIDPGDVEEGMVAANAIGDDTLMKQAGQRPVESMFTHGSSEQRMSWLRKGLNSGDPNVCNTFKA